MHQADVAVQDGAEWFASDLGIAMRNSHGVLFMQHDDHLRFLIAEMVNQTVVQAAKARAGV